MIIAVPLLLIANTHGGFGYCLDTVTFELLFVRLNEIGRADAQITNGVGLRSIISRRLNFKVNVPGPDSSEALNSHCSDPVLLGGVHGRRIWDGWRTCRGLRLRSSAETKACRMSGPGQWRRGVVPNAGDVWAMAQWACPVPGGLSVLLTGCPYALTVKE